MDYKTAVLEQITVGTIHGLNCRDKQWNEIARNSSVEKFRRGNILLGIAPVQS